MVDEKSPFRSKSPPLELVRKLLRSYRILKIRIALGKKFIHGNEFSIGKNFDIRSPERFHTGNRIGIGKNFTVECNAEIGDDVLISSNVTFIGNDHKFDDPLKTIYTQGRFNCPDIILEGNNVIGFGSIIIGPCRIKRGAIIAAGSVVKGEIDSYQIYGGIPAKRIKPRFSEKSNLRTE